MFKLFLGETCFHYSPSYFHVYQFDWTLILLNCFVFTHRNFCGEDERQMKLHDLLSFRLFQWITFLIATIWIQIEGRLIFKLKMAKNLRLLNGWYACWKVLLIIFKKQVLSLGFLIRLCKKDSVLMCKLIPTTHVYGLLFSGKWWLFSIHRFQKHSCAWS